MEKFRVAFRDWKAVKERNCQNTGQHLWVLKTKTREHYPCPFNSHKFLEAIYYSKISFNNTILNLKCTYLQKKFKIKKVNSYLYHCLAGKLKHYFLTVLILLMRKLLKEINMVQISKLSARRTKESWFSVQVQSIDILIHKARFRQGAMPQGESAWEKGFPVTPARQTSQTLSGRGPKPSHCQGMWRLCQCLCSGDRNTSGVPFPSDQSDNKIISF